MISNKRPKKQLPYKTLLAVLKWHSALLLLSVVAAFYFSIHTYPGFSASAVRNANYTMQNLGILFIFLEVALAYSMNSLQGSAYWLPWPRFRKAQLDERQTAVRQRVYEQAFVITVVALCTVVPLVSTILAQYSSPARGELLGKFALIAGVFIVNLPASLAAWQKDS